MLSNEKVHFIFTAAVTLMLALSCRNADNNGSSGLISAQQPGKDISRSSGLRINLVKWGHGTYQVISSEFNKSGQIAGMSMANGGTAELADYTGADHQKWRITYLDNGYYTMMNVGSGKFMQSYNHNGIQVLIQNSANGGDSQLWQLNEISSKKYKVINKASGLAVTADGTAMTKLKTYSGENSQIWGCNELLGNPVLDGWYADPDAAVFKNEFWIVTTTSVDCNKQVYFDAFSSKDLVKWTKYSHVVDSVIVKWGKTCFWAPGITTKNNKYYIFFSAKGKNFSHSIGVCVADAPGGPYKDLLGKPLLSERFNNAQPIDQSIFKDADGQYYMLYGGESHCNIVKLNDDFTGFKPFSDGLIFKEITPRKDYVEGPVMFIRKGKYYLMWSEGLRFSSNYRVAYGVADSPVGPFKPVNTILQGDNKIAAGPGHHSIINTPGTDNWYMVYHRRPLGDNDGNHRVTCIDRMYFNADGTIQPVKMTFDGVAATAIILK